MSPSLSSSSSRPVPQTSSGRLVSLSVDNPKNYTSQSHLHSHQEMPSLIPIAAPVSAAPLSSYVNDDSAEKTMLWTNVAALFVKCEQNEENMKESVSTLTRGSDEMYQELQDIRADLAQVQTDINENNVLSTHVRKLRKYVNRKCEKVRETVSYGSYNADTEIFAYVDKLRGEFNTRLQKIESENTELRKELSELHDTYDSDYDLFVQRENDLMSKLEAAIHTTECLNDRVKDYEEIMMRQIHEANTRAEQRLYQSAGGLREEFAHAISREVEFESKTSAQLVQSVNDELTELITRSNQYHSHRYFGTVEDVKQLREICQTLKQSIGMVDAELSDTNEIVEFLKEEVAQSSNDVYELKEDMVELRDDVYHEMDRDYYDLKDHVRRRMNRHKKQDHVVVVAPITVTDTVADTAALAAAPDSAPDAIQMIVNEYTEQDVTAAAAAAAEEAAERDDHVIIIDENTVFSDDEEEEVRHT